MLLITLINAAQMRQRAPAAGQAARLLHQNTPQKNRMRCRAFSLGITGHHWGPLGTAGMAGMPPPHFSLGSCPTFGGVGVGMAGVFLDCIPKCLPLREAVSVG